MDFNASSNVLIAVCALVADDISNVATELKELVVAPNSVALLPAAVICPKALESSMVPVTVVESLPPLVSVLVVAPAVTSAVMVPLVKSANTMSRPSDVDSVIADLSVAEANEAVTPVVDCNPLMAEAKPLRSAASVIVAETVLPLIVKAVVPVPDRLPSVALLDAVAVMPIPEAAVLMAAAIALASSPAA